MSLYANTLIFHNLNRWLVIALAVAAIVNSARGIRKQTFSRGDNLLQAVFVGVCHLQLVLGLILYSVSPFVNQAFRMGIRNAMGHDELRFYAVEHVLVMFIAIMLIQAGRAISKKQTDAVMKHRKVLTFFTIGLLLILLKIPWQRLLWPL